MKRTFVILALLAISICNFAQQTGANKRVQYFIKTWGFLKYHHPAIAQGSIDWDSVFIHKLPLIIAANNTDEFNRQLTDMMQYTYTATATGSALQATTGSLFELNTTGINWITNAELLSSDVKKRLVTMYNAPGATANRYISIANNTADFSGEKAYDNIGFPDMPYRLLFLARCWNIINYFAPYKYLTSDWDGVLLRFIPAIMHVQDSLSYYKTLQQFCKSLNDGHSQLALNGQMLPGLYFGKYAAPFYCSITEGQVVIRHIGNDSVANACNIQQGDIILSIDNKDISQIIKDKAKYISASNEPDESHQLSRFIADGETEKVELKLKRDNKSITTSFKRTSGQNKDWRALINYSANDAGYQMLNDSVLLVYAMQIWNGNLDTIKQLVRKAKAVIFDVRNYPQNDAFYMIPDLFLSKPVSIDYSTVAMPSKPGYFTWRLNPNKIGHESDSAYKGKVIILCDARTQSQGEYSCMVLQTIPGAVTIGSQTAGADGIVTNIPMGGGLAISYSGYGVYYPDKSQTQRTGVKINIPVKQTIRAIQEGKDEILNRALEYIKTGH